MTRIPLLAVFLMPAVAAGQIEDRPAPAPIDFNCPGTLDVDGRTLELVERSSGVWRIGEAVAFWNGEGRFWRLVCAYGSGRRDALEVVAYWADRAHQDGRILLEGTCMSSPGPGAVASAERQAKAWSTVPAGQALAAEMLAAVETRAVPCPGSAGYPRVCKTWKVEEEWTELRNRNCTWEQSDEPWRFVYSSECQFGGFATEGRVRRISKGVFERVFGRGARYHYRGDFESAGEVRGWVQFVRQDGSRNQETAFVAHCLEEASVR